MKTTLYKVRWSGYDRTGDTWEPIIHLQGYANMVKAFKESHEKDVERLAAERRSEAESKESYALKNAPKHTVLCMKGLTSPVWTMGMFQMVTGDSCQCMKHTKQCTVCDVSYIQSCDASASSDDQRASNAQDLVCSHGTEGDYFHT